MADLVQIGPGETDLGKIVAALRAVIERFPASEDAAAAATPTTTQIISGAGLTGGGDLSADRTMAVGAGTGITVNADDVAVATDGVTNTLLANMATKTYKGRTSGGTGDPEDVAVATVRSDISAEQLGYVRGFNVQGSNYTVASGDEGQTIYMNNGGSNVTLTLPTGFNNGYVNIIQAGTGTVTLAAGAGATLNAYNSAFKLAGQWAMATAVQSGAAWFAGGNLVP